MPLKLNQEEPPTINLTSMIDILFLLIIFFLVSSHLSKQENFLPLELPIASTGVSDFSDRMTLTIQIPSDGSYLVNNARSDLEQIQASILQKLESNGKSPIRIRIRNMLTNPLSRRLLIRLLPTVKPAEKKIKEKKQKTTTTTQELR